MSQKKAILWLIVIATFSWSACVCCAEHFFEMHLDKPCIYTPGKFSLALELTEKATVEGQYNFAVSVFLIDELVRKESIDVDEGKNCTYELEFPEVRGRTDGRIRCELFLNQHFIETQEQSLGLWPKPIAFTKKLERTIWLYDISAQLQVMFERLEIDFQDVTFQPVRQFSKPDIVFIGEFLDAHNMKIITESISEANHEALVIYLRQNKYPDAKDVEVVRQEQTHTITVDSDSPLLKGLTALDIMDLAGGVPCLKFKIDPEVDTLLKSFVTVGTEAKKHIYTYLAAVHEQEHISVFCQLPVARVDDPRSGILLENLLRFAYSTIVVSKD